MEGTKSAFAVGLIAGAAVSSLSMYIYLKRAEVNVVASSSGASKSPASATTAAAVPASLLEFEHDEVLAEQLTRNTQFFGIEKQRAIANAFVVVIGLGVSCQADTDPMPGIWSRQPTQWSASNNTMINNYQKHEDFVTLAASAGAYCQCVCRALAVMQHTCCFDQASASCGWLTLIK